MSGLLSDSLDLHASNVWSDPAVARQEHHATSGGAVRGREWRRAAAVVHEISALAQIQPGDVCSWNEVTVHHSGNDVLILSGLNHLLPSGRGAGGVDEEAAELHVACFMGLISFLTSRPEVLRVSPKVEKRLLNAAARAIIQSATVTDSPLTDVGLDGTGQVIQVSDSGLDESSCYFADDSGEEVEHGHYFEELGLSSSYVVASTSDAVRVFEGGDFQFDETRRKIIQYINIIKPDTGESSSHGSYFTTANGYLLPWIPADSFGEDDVAGHGTHTAGSAAGSTVNTPAIPVTCPAGRTVSCVGGCIDEDAGEFSDDLVSSMEQYVGADLDRMCPMFGCGAAGEDYCLTDDVSATLTSHGGVAQGAKLAIFDTFDADGLALMDFAATGMWESCMEAGCTIHSGSYGGDLECNVDAFDLMNDEFMYDNPGNLLVFAAGNEGDIKRSTCTIGAPAIGKNALAIGATSSGETRATITNADGITASSSSTAGPGDIDTVAAFSSYGPTLDGRIKPEVVAPGDLVYSAAGDGTDSTSCRLWGYYGTSMSCPIVSGSAAMVRQYFEDATYYASDVAARGFCDDGFICDDFSPSSATLKALLINSANLMGGSSEPDGYRGFGRVHLEMGLPLNGAGDTALFVADAQDTSIADGDTTDYLFDVSPSDELDFRATLSWIDPPATSLTAAQLVNDLDLSVIGPDGTEYTMWVSGEADDANVNERVIVDAAEVQSGTWTVRVSANALSTDEQAYSLVVNGAISPASGEGADPASSSSVRYSSRAGLLASLLVSVAATVIFG